MSALAEITVKYQTRKGWHLFTSDQMDGLFVASTDLRTAFDDVPEAVSMLLKLDHGVECVVQPKLDFEGFLALQGSRGRARQSVAARLGHWVAALVAANRRNAFLFTVVPPYQGYTAATRA